MLLRRKIAIVVASAIALVAGTIPAQAIEGGSPATVSKFPFMVLVQQHHWLYGWQDVCGGVLVTEIHVLTAASCIDTGVNPKTDYRMILGEEDTSLTQGNEVTQAVSSIAVHPAYDSDSRAHDLAVVTLQDSVKLDGAHSHLKTVKLSKGGSPVPVGTRGDVAGWGATGWSARVPSVLQAATVPVVPKRECADAYGDLDLPADAYLCAGFDEASACPGDEGGPLVAGLGSSQRLIGIVSATAVCGLGMPSVFTDVASHATWIKQQAPGV